MRPFIELAHATIAAPGGRVLFDELAACVGRERVALVGRNGVGKSTLLDVLAGVADVERGRVRTSSLPWYVPQLPDGPPSLSAGERRRRALEAARSSGAEILLLDEPTEDLDDASVRWVREWLRSWPGCLVVASHDRRLLADFRGFFVATEAGCRYFEGTLGALEDSLEKEHHDTETRYVRTLRRLADHEEASIHVARRKARKQRYGRCSEIDRNSPRIRLNQKRSEAQVSHGRLARLREARSDALRAWSKSMRRALAPRLELELGMPTLEDAGTEGIVARAITARVGDRRLFGPIDLAVGRERLAIVGPNGSGKSTLIEMLVGRRAPSSGSVASQLGRIGIVAQGGADWMSEDSLLDRLASHGATPDELAPILVAHKFPLALAERPIRSLSPGERARAALITLFRRAPSIDILVLDEPTYALDLVGQRALTRALRAWPGGLIVASHDRDFLAAIGTEARIELGE